MPFSAPPPGSGSRSGSSLLPTGAGRSALPPVTVAAAPSSGGGSNFFGRFFSDIKNAAVESPGAIVGIGRAIGEDTAGLLGHLAPSHSYAGRVARQQHGQIFPETREIASALGTQTLHDIEHPLDRPGNTLLDLLAFASLGAGTAARIAGAGRAVGEAGAAATAGEKAAAAVRAFGHPPNPPPLVMRVDGIEATRPASRAALTRAVQEHVNHLRNMRPDMRLGFLTQRTRVQRAIKRLSDTELKTLTSKAQYVAVAGRRVSWNSPEGAAMRAVADGTPVDQRIALHQHDLAETKAELAQTDMRDGPAKSYLKTVERALNVQIHALTEAVAKGYVPADGIPTILEPKLARLYDLTKEAALDHDQRLVQSGVMTEPGAASAIQAPGRVFSGAETLPAHPPTPAILGHQARVERLQGLVAKAERKVALGRFTRQQREYLAEGPWAPIRDTAGNRVTAAGWREAALKVQLDELEAVWNSAVDNVEGGYKNTAADRAEQARRNAKARRRANRGLPPLPTAAKERRSFAEKQLIDLLHTRPSDPYVRKLQAVVDQADEIRQRLSQAADAKWGFSDSPGTSIMDGPVPDLSAPMPGGIERVTRTGRIIAPAGTARLRQMNAALGVAKEDLDRAVQSYATRRGIHPSQVGDRGGLVGAEDYTGGQFHVGYRNEPAVGAARLGPVRVGSGKVIREARQAPARFRQAFTGASVHEGLFGLDVPQIVAHNIVEGERFMAAKRMATFYADHAAETPEGIASGHAVAIALDELGSNPLPRSVQDFLRRDGKTEADHQAARTILGLVFDDWRAKVFPVLPSGEWELHPNVRWIDDRLLGGLNKPTPYLDLTNSRGVRWTDSVNNASKAAILYLKLAYLIPNVIGNAFLALTHEGFAAPVNLADAIRLSRKLPGEDVRLIDMHGGEGFAGALRTEGGTGEGIVNRGARYWGVVVDLPFRRASFLYEARKAGATSWEQIHDLLHDPMQLHTLNEVTQRANRAMIDYGDLNPVEQALIRRIVFLYPWLKGSTRYLGEYVSQHPIQAGAMANLGQYGEQQQEAAFGGPLREWAQGKVGVGGDSFDPTTIDLTSTGILGQPIQLGEAIAGYAGLDDQARGDLNNLLTPFLSAAETSASGYDAFTHRTVPAGGGTFLRQLAEPGANLWRTAHGQEQPSRTYPGNSRQEAWLRYLLGGWAPRVTNTDAVLKP